MNVHWLIVLALLWLLALGCDSEAKQQAQETQLIEQYVSARLQDYERTLRERCQERVLTEAIRVSDSLIILEARLSKDTIFKPYKPERPERPEAKVLNDTTPLRPILSRPDSLR
ncbi:MAG TPA: hypothetical protein PKD70_05085 [Saprospiraceae bacterium]|nr:hypothetical protein [Saprospiraceae bacterium]HMP13232.1 hypothetical protein [Saprospiraceae bacterium]